MKRLILPAFVTSATLAGGLLVAACDPDLGVVSAPGTEAGTAAGKSETSAPLPPEDSGATLEAGADGGEGDDGGTEAGAEHAIDGTNDFAAGEKLATSSPGYDAYVSWDEKKIYLGMSGGDVGSGSSSKWVLVYVDGNPGNAGTTTGQSYDCSGGCKTQQAQLAFNAGFHLRWKADGSYTFLQKWNGTAWTDVGPISTFARKGTFWEVSLLRSILGSPTTLKLHMSMVIEQPGVEWTYAGVPSSSFKDGDNNPAFKKYYELDLADTSKAPNTYAPKP
jgi:hypothetical protein